MASLVAVFSSSYFEEDHCGSYAPNLVPRWFHAGKNALTTSDVLEYKWRASLKTILFLYE